MFMLFLEGETANSTRTLKERPRRDDSTTKLQKILIWNIYTVILRVYKTTTAPTEKESKNPKELLKF